MQIKDLFGNEIIENDAVVNVLIHKNEAKFRTGIIECIVKTPRGVSVYVRNSDTHRLTMKTTTSKDGYICKDILKYDWRKFKPKGQLSLFPELDY